MHRRVAEAAIRHGGKRFHRLQRQQCCRTAASGSRLVGVSSPSSELACDAVTIDQRVSLRGSSSRLLVFGGRNDFLSRRHFHASYAWLADGEKVAKAVESVATEAPPADSGAPNEEAPSPIETATASAPEPVVFEAPTETEAPKNESKSAPELSVVEAPITQIETLREKVAPAETADVAAAPAPEPKAPPVVSPAAKAPKATAEPTRAAPPSTSGGPPVVDGVKQYSTPELTKDAAKHKAGLDDPTRPEWQNPLHHNNPEMQKIFREDFASDEAFDAAVNPAPPVADVSGKVAAPAYLHELADEMVHLTMLEMNELINRIADHYGFHEGMLSPDNGEEGAEGDDDDQGGAAAPVVEKTAFDVKLVSYDASLKLKIIKEVRVIVPGLGLKEAKELVEGAPCAIQKGVSKEVADEIKVKLEALGAVMEIV